MFVNNYDYAQHYGSRVVSSQIGTPFMTVLVHACFSRSIADCAFNRADFLPTANHMNLNKVKYSDI